MPFERERLFRLDPIDDDLELLPGMRLLHLGDRGIDGRRLDAAGHRLAGDERPVEADAEPLAELRRVTDCAPHARERSAQQRLLFNAVSNGRAHRSPPFCQVTSCRWQYTTE